MSADRGLYQEITEQIETAVSGTGVRITTVRRLALLTPGLLAAKRSAVGPMASERAVGGRGERGPGPEHRTPAAARPERPAGDGRDVV